MTKTKRPAEELVESINETMKLGADSDVDASSPYRLVPIATLKEWRRLAKSVDARMRLDGSKLNKRKSAGRKRVTR